MSIRSNALPVGRDLAPELQEILRKNGMQAHIIRQGEGYQLAVQGHDSPLLTYAITAQQHRALVDWGANSANKQAYNTVAELVKNDFYMPRDFVHARNANGRVAMGLHGYRIGVGEYGRLPWNKRHAHMMMDPYHGRFLGWTPRCQEGFHMRRVGGAMFMQGAPIVPERPDGRMKPGELQNGCYGFYYKGGQQNMVQQPSQDVLADLQSVITPVVVRPRPKEPAKPYNELITSKVYFSNDKWQECLSSHGIIVDAANKTLTIQSTAAKQDFVYDLTEDEVKKLTNNSIKQVPVQNRIDIINNAIRNDFQDKLTMDMLNSKEQISLKLRPEIEAELNNRQQMVIDQSLPSNGDQITIEPEDRSVAHVDGNSLYEQNESKGWFREGKHGREVQVDDIKVEPVRNEQGEIQKDEKGNAKYRMTAVINGESISHEITQKQYDKFLAINDYQRMKLFDKIFPEVEMKTKPESRFNLGAAILAAVTVGADVVAGLSAPPRPRPEIYESAPVFHKPGVVSPQAVSAAVYESLAEQPSRGQNEGMGMGR